jgi:hypothetical protein
MPVLSQNRCTYLMKIEIKVTLLDTEYMSGVELISSKFDNLHIPYCEYFGSEFWEPYLKLLHTEHSMLT